MKPISGIINGESSATSFSNHVIEVKNYEYVCRGWILNEYYKFNLCAI